MSHFNFSYTDLETPDATLVATAKHQKNYTSTEPLKTSGSETGNGQIITTYSLSDIAQGLALYKPKSFILDSQENVVSRSLQALVSKEGEGNIDNVISSGTRNFVPPSLRVNSFQDSQYAESYSMEIITKAATEGSTAIGGGQANSTSGGFSSGATAGGGTSTVVSPGWHEPAIPNMHAKVTNSITQIDLVPEIWRNIGRLKDSELKPSAFAEYENARLPLEALTELTWGGAYGGRLWAPAAQALYNLMNAAKYYGFKEPFYTDTYRDFAVQAGLKKRKPYLANAAGTSMHGWGIAIDFHNGFIGGKVRGLSGYEWMILNSYKFGISEPEWALPRGFHTEAWHFEYRGHLYDAMLNAMTSNILPMG